MKKVLLTLVAVLATMTASAQVYVGGSVGFGSVKPIGGGDSESTYKIIPEIGYNLTDEWAVGIELGYQKGACSIGSLGYSQDVDTEVFGIAPYARYSPIKWNAVTVFFDGGLAFQSLKDIGTNFALGIKPGVAVSLTDEISFVAHMGFVGFETFSPKGDGKSGSDFGVDLSNNISFGVYFNF